MFILLNYCHTIIARLQVIHKQYITSKCVKCFDSYAKHRVIHIDTLYKHENDTYFKGYLSNPTLIRNFVTPS